ncbi:hypothetical protein BvCmsOUNP009_01531 [Escherichia coli]|nr:hypothetical protein HmCmsJML007_03487 [Escherichia coli]GDQ83626.1 hypothetical protein BvCmsOUNP009_01531 [Escherichia coli]
MLATNKHRQFSMIKESIVELDHNDIEFQSINVWLEVFQIVALFTYNPVAKYKLFVCTHKIASADLGSKNNIRAMRCAFHQMLGIGCDPTFRVPGRQPANARPMLCNINMRTQSLDRLARTISHRFPGKLLQKKLATSIGHVTQH